MRFFISMLCLITLIHISVVQSHSGEIKPNIIFDEGHGQGFVIDNSGELQLSKLADTMRASGALVASTKEVLSDDSLKGATALIISGPFKQINTNEIDSILRFIQKGGKLVAMMHIGPPLSNLLFRLGLTYSKSVLHENQNVIDKDINFRVTDLSPNPLFTGIDSFAAYGVWAINPGDKAASIARTSPKSWIDMDNDGKLSKSDIVGSFAVVVTESLGSGSFTIFGDDAIFQNKFLEGNNQKLALNLAKWLTGR